MWEAALGAKIEVPTIDGRTLLKIPQGTNNGQKFRLREKGVLNSRTNQRGDQIVEVAIEAPDPHDERTRELLRELAKLHPEDPRAGNVGEGLSEGRHGKSQIQSGLHDLGGGRAVRHPPADAAALRARRAC